MSESYPFPIYSGLLEPKHCKRIGSAIWLFLWCISSTTREEEREGVTWGIVLGNKPIKLDELASRFGVDEKTIRRWIKALEQHEYIQVTRAPYGIMFAVKNSKKIRERSDKNVHSDEADRTKMSTLSERDRTEMPDLRDKNVHSNKDIIQDINNTAATTNANKEPFDEIFDEFCILHGKLDIHVKAYDVKLMQEMIALGVPSSLIIKVMRQVYQERAEAGKKIHSFSYYKSAILEAWETEQSITTPVPSGTVALGQGGTNDAQAIEKLSRHGGHSPPSAGNQGRPKKPTGYYDQYPGLIQSL